MMPGPSSSNGVVASRSFLFFRGTPWFYTLLSCFILIAVFGARQINDYDLGYHLKGGQWILQNHSFPSHDTFTYTVASHEYLDIHWLFQVSLYLLYRLGGYSLLSIANIVLILFVFFITFLRLKLTGAPLWICVVLLGATVLGSEIRFQTRPEILSWVFMSLTLWALELRVNRERNLLFLLPLVQLAWVNTEGLFPIGLFLMLAYLISGLLHDRQPDKKLFKISGLSAALCLLNPYFIRGVLFPFSLIATLGTLNVLKRSINEFQSPWALAFSSSLAPRWTLGAYELFSVFLLFLLAATYKKRKIRDWLLAGFFFYLSCTSLRNIPIFMLSCAPLAAACWKELSWAWLAKLQSAVFSRPLAAWAGTVFFLGLSLRVASGAYYVSEHRIDGFGLGLDLEKQPVRAAQFLAQNRLDGKILNHLNSGGWLDWQGPQKTFIDGRLEVMGADFFAEFDESRKPGGLASLFSKYRPEILFFNPEDAPQWLSQLRLMPDWRPVYLDECAVIYLRKNYAAQMADLNHGRVLVERGVSPDILKEAPSILRLSPPAFETYWKGFYQPSEYPLGLAAIGTYYLHSGQPALAEMVYLECIRRTRGKYWELFLQLGGLYVNTRRYAEAKICLERIERQAPGFAKSQKLTNSLPPSGF